jgi:hypothetical protein
LVTVAKEAWYFPKLMSLGRSPGMHVVSLCLGVGIVWYVWHLRRVGQLK